MSVDASGTVAKTITFRKWKGRNYVARWAKPSNPKAVKQVAVRSMLRFLSQDWVAVPGVDQATWEEAAASKKISPFNEFISYGMMRFRNGLFPSEAYPAAVASTAPSAPTLVATGGTRQVSLAITEGATPPVLAWVIYRGAAAPTGVWSEVAFVISPAGAITTWVDTPLVAGTYHYKVRGCNLDGKAGALSAADTTGIAAA